MKHGIIISILILNLLAILSCHNDSQIGKWDDIIKLSTKNVEFNSTADSVIISTGGVWWWVTDVSVDSIYYCDFQGVDPESDQYTIKQGCFDVEKRDNHTIFIKIDENPTNIARIITVGLQAGDYFDRITITQDPK